VPQLSQGTVNMLLLLGPRTAADAALLSQLARLLQHTLLRATVLLGAAGGIAEGQRRLLLVRGLLPQTHISLIFMILSLE
jgi:hypothetical protein